MTVGGVGYSLRSVPAERELGFSDIALGAEVRPSAVSGDPPVPEAAEHDLAAALAFFRPTIGSTGCTPKQVVTDKAAFYPSAIRACAPGAKHTATDFYNLVISTNRCERNGISQEFEWPGHSARQID